MSKANDIAEQIVARLRGILQAHGYHTDAGVNVSRGRRSVSSFPALVVFEQEDLVESQAADGSGDVAGSAVNSGILLQFDVRGVDECEADVHMASGHALVADIKRAIFGGDMRWGGLATHTRYVGRTIDPRVDGDTTVSVVVHIHVGMVENLANP